MWWVSSETKVQAWLGRTRVRLKVEGRELLGESVANLDAGVAVLAEWNRDLPKHAVVRVWLGGDVSRLACLPAIAGARHLQDAQAAVNAWMTQQALMQPGWIASLPLAPKDVKAWRVALTPATVVPAIDDALTGRLRAVRPWWSWAFQALEVRAQAPSNAAGRSFCAFDGEALTAAAWTPDNQLISAETVAPMTDASIARRWLLRRGLQGADGGSLHCVRLDWADTASGAHQTGESTHEQADSQKRGTGEFAFENWVRFSHAL